MTVISVGDVSVSQVIENQAVIDIEKEAAKKIITAYRKARQYHFSLDQKISLSNFYAKEKESLELGLCGPGGHYAIYHNKYRSLTDEQKGLVKGESLSIKEKVKYLNGLGCPLTCYFNEEKAKTYLIQNTSFDKIIGLYYENCIIVRDGLVYVYPKRKRSSIAAQVDFVGKSHSSLNSGNPVDFAGTIRSSNDRWIICNLSGHYETRASKMTTCLQALQKQNISLENVDLEHWILVENSYKLSKVEQEDRSIRIYKERNFTYLIKGSSATLWLKKTESLSLDKKLPAIRLIQNEVSSKCSCTVS